MATNKTVFFMIGVLLVVLGVFYASPYIMQLIYNENNHSFISSAFVTIFIGILFILANLEKEFKSNLRQTFLFSTLAWFMVVLEACLFFYLPKNLLLAMPFLRACLVSLLLEQR